jgi:N-acetylmuramoyl-L-alanine amidase
MLRLLALLGSLIALTACATEPAAAPLRVAIDIGHSLAHPGATGASGTTEFQYNRELAHRVVARLQQQGVIPTLIGDAGDMTDLAERTRLATGQQLFVSLHHDSVQPRYLPTADRFHGYSLFVSRKNPKPEASLACAREVARRLQAAGLTPSLHHAEAIPGENRPFADKALGIYWFDELVVLKSARQPALLIESGVIVNPKEEAWLASESGRNTLAGAIASGIRRCQPLLD